MNHLKSQVHSGKFSAEKIIASELPLIATSQNIAFYIMSVTGITMFTLFMLDDSIKHRHSAIGMLYKDSAIWLLLFPLLKFVASERMKYLGRLSKVLYGVMILMFFVQFATFAYIVRLGDEITDYFPTMYNKIAILADCIIRMICVIWWFQSQYYLNELPKLKEINKKKKMTISSSDKKRKHKDSTSTGLSKKVSGQDKKNNNVRKKKKE